jgi:hypothetical protein
MSGTETPVTMFWSRRQSQENTLAMLRMVLHIAPDVTLRDLINVVHCGQAAGACGWLVRLELLDG